MGENGLWRRFLIAVKSSTVSAAIIVGGSAQTSVAGIVFRGSMNHVDSAALREVWTKVGAVGSEANRAATLAATTLPPVQTPASGTNLSLANGLVYAQLPSPVAGSFKLRFRMLDTSYSRSSHLAILDASGRHGYGVRWNTNQVTQYGGRGSLTLTKLAFPAAWEWSNPMDHGTPLATVGPNHPATGYAVVAVDPPVSYPSIFQDFCEFEFGWDSARGVLSLSQNGQLMLLHTELGFAPIFSKIYFYGNATSALDEVELELVSSSGVLPAESDADYGAVLPFTTIEAEEPANSFFGGTVVRATKSQLGTSPPSPAQEASGRGYVQLNSVGHYVEIPDAPTANAMVIRHCIPDAPAGGGIAATLSLYVNGVFRQKVNLSSKYNWLYAATPASDDNGQSNTPTAFPHVYWDETRLFIMGGVQAGDSIRLQRDTWDTAAYYRIDLVDLEWVPAPLPQPVDSLSVTLFGANQNCWLTHTGVGRWMAGFDGRISGCRVRLTYADGINLNNGNNLNTDTALVENNHIRSQGRYFVVTCWCGAGGTCRARSEGRSG